MRDKYPYFIAAIIFTCWSTIALSDQFGDAGEVLTKGDYARAFTLFKPLAEGGDPAAQNNLGILYREGQGTTQNYPESLKWFHRSADQGSAWAEYNLGLAYQYGYGVIKNEQEAFQWYMKSANKGDSAAQAALGFMYRDGVGVDRNEPEAIKWFKRASEQNNAAARQALALLSHDLNTFAFVMPSFWLFSRSSSIVDGDLLFRRYSVITEKQNLHEIDSGATDRLEIIGEPGSLTNSMIFTCHRSRKILDHLTVHLPERVDPISFKHEEWVSRLEIRVLADNRSTKVEGEYIKGDLFIDENAYSSINDFQKLLSVSRLIIEFGEKNDRVVLAASDQFGNSRLGSFMREYLPRIPNFSTGLRFLSSADMLNFCFNFKKNGILR